MSRPDRLRRVRPGARKRVGFGLALVVSGCMWGLGAARSAGPSVVTTINGQRLSESTATKPIVLEPQRKSELAFELTNDGTDPLVVHQILLVGRVMAIRFFTFTYTLPADVQANPGETATATVPLDMPGLRSQILGLLPGRVTLFSPDGAMITSEDFVMEAKGSLQSVYGVLGVAIGVTTIFGFFTSVLALARHRLSPHRWNRAFRFLLLGIGLGLSLVFAFSIERVFVPQPSSCARLILICSGVLFALGFLTPRPPIYSDDLEIPSKPAATEATVGEQ